MAKLRMIVEADDEFVEDLNEILGTNSAYESAIALKAMLRMYMQDSNEYNFDDLEEHISCNFEVIDE